MADRTNIEWADDSVNFWWGCVEVGPGCDNCYARELAKRFKNLNWGPFEPRLVMPNAFKNLDRFQSKAKGERVRRKVFVNSMSDLAEILPEGHPQRDELNNIRAAYLVDVMRGRWPDIDHIWLTKRIGNVKRVVPLSWLDGRKPWPSNLWIVPTVCNQAEAARDVPKLLALPAPVRGLSCEPLLGPIDLFSVQTGELLHTSGNEYAPGRLDWVIVGGESGPKARTFDPDWGRHILSQCKAACVPFFGKQWDKKRPLPDDLMVRQFPSTIGVTA